MTLRPRFVGTIEGLAPADRRLLVERSLSELDPEVMTRARAIVEAVKRDGDPALVRLSRELDGVALERFEVPRAAQVAALDAVPTPLRKVLERALANIERVHRAFMPAACETEVEPGVVVGRRPDPLGAVGVYAPGGRAAYPSSVLMGVVPARVAGVSEIVVTSPPSRAASRSPGEPAAPHPLVLAAACLAGATRVFSLGGAQAIAALAFGTESVPRVDRIVGPGNAYVAAAKQLVAGTVGIDAPAGPSEIVVVFDDGASGEGIARELVAQAEHDPDACVVAVGTSPAVADDIVRALAATSPGRREIVSASMAARSAVLVARSLDEALAFANELAAEHLLLAVRELDAALAKVRSAGTVFVGESASVAFGDYMTGANHVLPTAGLARSWSGLSTLDFVRWTTTQRVSREAAARLADDVGAFADVEGLPGHAAAARAFTAPGARS